MDGRARAQERERGKIGNEGWSCGSPEDFKPLSFFSFSFSSCLPQSGWMESSGQFSGPKSDLAPPPHLRTECDQMKGVHWRRGAGKGRLVWSHWPRRAEVAVFLLSEGEKEGFRLIGVDTVGEREGEVKSEEVLSEGKCKGRGS